MLERISFRTQSRQQEVHAVPPSFLQHRQRGFPAVYVQDGSSLFQNQIELLESAFQQQRLPELVLIGIEPENRLDEYTPWPAASLSDRFTDFGGMGYHYLSDITNQFIPLIEENWNVTREPQSRGMIGALIRRPHLNVRHIKISVNVRENRLYIRFILVRERSGNHSYIFFKAWHCTCFHVYRE